MRSFYRTATLYSLDNGKYAWRCYVGNRHRADPRKHITLKPTKDAAAMAGYPYGFVFGVPLTRN